MKSVSMITINGTPVEYQVKSVGPARSAVYFEGTEYIFPMSIKHIKEMVAGCDDVVNVRNILESTTVTGY